MVIDNKGHIIRANKYFTELTRVPREKKLWVKRITEFFPHGAWLLPFTDR